MESNRANAVINHIESLGEDGDTSWRDEVEKFSVRVSDTAETVRDLIEAAMKGEKLATMDREPRKEHEIRYEFAHRQAAAIETLEVLGDDGVYDVYQRGEDPEDQDRKTAIKNGTRLAEEVMRRMSENFWTKLNVRVNRRLNKLMLGGELRSKFRQVKALKDFPEFRKGDTLETIKELMIEGLDADGRELFEEIFPEIVRITGLDLMHEES